jgi:hypothetical protein
MKLKLISEGLDSSKTTLVDENGEIIEGVQAVYIDIVAGEIGNLTVIFNNADLELTELELDEE